LSGEDDGPDANMEEEQKDDDNFYQNYGSPNFICNEDDSTRPEPYPM